MFEVKSVVVGETSFDIRRDEEGRINANDAHRASGGAAKHAPGQFMRLKKTQKLAEKIGERCADLHSVIFIEVGGEGGGGSTWMHEEMFYAYCAWIDDAFYAAMVEVFGHAARGDGERAVAAAQSVVRLEGKQVRKNFASQLGRFAEGGRAFFGDMTDAQYIALFGKSSSSLKAEKGLKRSESLRDNMSDLDLARIQAAESLSAVRMMTVNTRGEAREVIYDSAQVVSNLTR